MRNCPLAPMAKAAVAASVDGPQTLNCEDFARLMKELRPVAEAVGRTL